MSRAGRAGRRFLRVLPEGGPYTGYRTRGFSLAKNSAAMSVFFVATQAWVEASHHVSMGPSGNLGEWGNSNPDLFADSTRHRGFRFLFSTRT